MEWWHIYLFTRLDSLNELFKAITIIGGIILLCVSSILPIANSEMEEENWSALLRGIKLLAVIWVIGLFTFIAIPTQKEAAAIYLIPKLANSEFAKEAEKIPTDTAKLLRLKLESYIEGIEGSVKKESK